MKNPKLCIECSWYSYGKCEYKRMSMTPGIFEKAKNMRYGGRIMCRILGTCGEEGRWFDFVAKDHERYIDF